MLFFAGMLRKLILTKFTRPTFMNLIYLCYKVQIIMLNEFKIKLVIKVRAYFNLLLGFLSQKSKYFICPYITAIFLRDLVLYQYIMLLYKTYFCANKAKHRGDIFSLTIFLA